VKPLEGVRILDFSRQFAGALGTRFLASLGAEVLRVEWPEAPGLDFVRLIQPADGIAGINRGGMFNAANVDKRSFTLNMATEEGRDLARQLVALSDVVYENMTPGVMQRWGLDYDALQAIRPDVIYVACSGFGHDGPSAHFRSYGSPSQGHTGLLGLAGLPGHPPAGWSFQIGDTHAGTNNALAVLMALHYRRVSGRGVFVDAAQTQANVTLLGEQLLEYSVNGTSRSGVAVNGNRRTHPQCAPYGAYRCLGTNRWCVIAVMSNEHWLALRSAMGEPAWMDDPRFTDAAGRVAHQDELDGHIGEWTVQYDRYWVARRLQDHGVPAGAVQNAPDRLNWDHQLQHRGTYAIYEHPETGPRRHETLAARLSDTPYEAKNAAPQLGVDNDYVFRELLGLGDDELRRLAALDAIRAY
jgi:crotonobetainyl-CoA:carnitine CoA-transferase CaiB-like acyl-CoA transferase